MGPGSLALFLLLIFAGNFAHASGYQGGGTGGGGGGATSLDGLSDVVISSPADGEFLRYDVGVPAWVNTWIIPGDIPAAPLDCGAGEFVKGIDASLVLDCAIPAGGSSSNSFESIATPLGSSPLVADSATDTLTLTSTGIVTITGTALTDTIMFGATEVGDISSVYDCTTGACTAMTIGSGQSLGVSGTGTNVATSGTTATGFFSTGTISPLRLPDADDDSTTKGIVTFLTEEFDCAAGVCLLSGGSIDGGIGGEIQDGSITTDDIASGSISHSSLANLIAPADDHTQYALLAGRTGAGGQILYGGTASGELLVLESTSNPTKGTIYFGLATEWEWSDGIVDPVDSSVAVGGKWDPTISVTGTSGGTSIVRGLSIAPTYNYDDASGVIINTYTGVEGGGTFTVSGAGTQASSWSLFNATALLTATAAAKVPPTPIVFRSGITVDYSATSGTGTMSLSKPFEDNTIYRNTDAGGIFAITAPSSFVSNPIFTETAGQLNITSFRGFFAMDPAINGTPQITNQFGVDVQRPTRGSTPATTVGVRNAGSEAYPPITQALADEFTITPSATIVQVTATTDPIDSGATAITDGADGQLLYIVNIDETAAQTITFADDSNTQLSAATIDLDRCDSITFLFMASIGDWIQVGNVNALC